MIHIHDLFPSKMCVILKKKYTMHLFQIMVMFLTNDLMTPGVVPQVISTDQASSLITESAPVSSVSPGSRTESPPKQKELQPGETNRPSREVNYDRGGKSAILSLASASTLRRSPRIKVSSHF